MDKCVAMCSEESKVDFDNLTDNIENVLSDETGRKLFRNFMFTTKLRDGRKKLDFWEHVDRIIKSKDDVLDELDSLIDEAERIDEIDSAIMERLTHARNKQELAGILKVLKVEATKALKKEYNEYRRHNSKPRNKLNDLAK